VVINQKNRKKCVWVISASEKKFNSKRRNPRRRRRRGAKKYPQFKKNQTEIKRKRSKNIKKTNFFGFSVFYVLLPLCSVMFSYVQLCSLMFS
jgi:hypothetical protein